MSTLQKYLLGVITAGLICAIIRALFPEKKGYSALIHMICSLFLTITILSPFNGLHFDPTRFLEDSLNYDKDYYIESGQKIADESRRTIISDSCRTYIVKKAASMGVDVDVEVILDSGESATPYAVTVSGAISPYIRSRLQSILSEELGIPKERQTWT